MVIATSLRADHLLLSSIDALAKRDGLSRNAWIVRALEEATGAAVRQADVGSIVEDHEGRIVRLEEVAGL